jgi:hypothetical protein
LEDLRTGKLIGTSAISGELVKATMMRSNI